MKNMNKGETHEEINCARAGKERHEEKCRAAKNETSQKGIQPGGHRADTQHIKRAETPALRKMAF